MGYAIGTDEAGYGPNLGPLVISATVWEIPDGVRAGEVMRNINKRFGPKAGDVVMNCNKGAHQTLQNDAVGFINDTKKLAKNIMSLK